MHKECLKPKFSIHSGIMKGRGNKSYHAYFSDSRIHDQVFVNQSIHEMLKKEDNIGFYDMIIIESDNCTSQYKSAQHFHDLQKISNQFDKTVVRIYGVAGHGKGEVLFLTGDSCTLLVITNNFSHIKFQRP